MLKQQLVDDSQNDPSEPAMIMDNIYGKSLPAARKTRSGVLYLRTSPSVEQENIRRGKNHASIAITLGNMANAKFKEGKLEEDIMALYCI